MQIAELFTTARGRSRLLNWFWSLILWALVAVILLPIFYMVLVSLKPRGEILCPYCSIFPTEWRFQNYSEMWKSLKFNTLFSNSLTVVGIATLIGTFFSALAAYALARFRFRGADAYSITVLATQLIPGTLFFIPLYLTFIWIKKNLGIPLVGSNLGGIVLYIGFYTPISIWILRSFFASIPVDLEEQAMVDGATRLEAFLFIVIPLAIPGIVSTAIYIFMTAWDEMFFSYTLGIKTIPAGVRQYITGAAGTQLRYDYMAAASLVVAIPIAVMFFLLQKRFIAGLTQGSVKG
ncbi:MAG: carbohydrate ABC transporter permease [Anaerolineales bacterium]|nr:carbohydrate ABC transporter permease [Anaerolineales bacterium]